MKQGKKPSYSTAFFRVLFLALPILGAALFSACAEAESVHLPTVEEFMLDSKESSRSNLTVGLVPGPHAQMFSAVIKPALEAMGYSVGIEYYQDYSFPNMALSRSLIDLNMYQHYSSLNDFKFENDLALSAIAEVPTMPMGIFSHDYADLSEIEPGASVSIPSDVSNRARALMVLESAHLIKVDHMADRRKLSEADVIDNPHELSFVPLRAENLVQSLSICELSVMDGNYAISGGLSISDQLYAEFMDEGYLNIIAVRTEDLSAQFVWDIISILGSDAYRAIIMDPDGNYADFQKPALLYSEQ